MDIDTAFIISGVMCIPFLTFVLYFFDDKKPKDEGWKGFFKWIITGGILNKLLGGNSHSNDSDE